MRSLKTLILCIFLAGASAAPSWAASTKDVETFVTTLGNKVVVLLKDKNLADAAKETQLKDIFRSNVDTDWIGQFVLGKYWREATDAQKKRYLELYREFLIESYTGRFKEYSGESFKITGSREETADKFLLNTEIVRPNNPSVIVDYKVKAAGNSLKVYDIVVEGVSLITTQRSEFTSVISRNGLDALINALEKRVKKPA